MLCQDKIFCCCWHSYCFKPFFNSRLVEVKPSILFSSFTGWRSILNQKYRTESIKALREKVIPRGHASATTCYVDRAHGALVYDVDGREFIDFGGGIAVMNVGHSHPKVVEAIKDQAEKFTHTCFMVAPYPAAVELADRLAKAAPGRIEKSVLFVNSGAEAVENAVKIARRASKKQAVVSFHNAFHGRTLLAMSLTSKVKPFKVGFGPFAPEVYHIPYAYCYRCPFGQTYPSCGVCCADYLKEAFLTELAPEDTAAVIVEPVQGEGGFIAPPPEFLPKIKQICEAHDILFIADEIQSGMGRTGKLFAVEHFNIEPDLMTVAKSLAAGMPLSAVIGKKEIMDAVHPGGIGGTYGGNPVACRAALAVLDIFDTEDMLGKAQRLGDILNKRLHAFKDKYELIGDVRGIGAMMAMELVEDRDSKKPAAAQAKTLSKYCFDHGLIILVTGTFGNVVRMLMPFVITDEQLERGLSIVEEGLGSLQR
jgi:4-aminobutyrate aminotransferase/(S)-3-amino-2-methylpropionate transaminase